MSKKGNEMFQNQFRLSVYSSFNTISFPWLQCEYTKTGINSVSGLFRRVAIDDVADVSEVHAAGKFLCMYTIMFEKERRKRE
jgi:uncharacterized membrane protein (DUF106 family)